MSDLFYLNTRLHAMRAQFLSRREYEMILALPDLSSIAAALRETPYGQFIDSTGGEVPEAARIEEALRRNVSQTLARLLAISSGDCAEAVRLVLGHWEVQAVKTVLRGLVSGAYPAEILSSLVPTGLHDEAALEEMCRQADPRALAELMVTWREPLGRALLRALPSFREPRDLAILESALDRCWFEQAASRLREIRPSSPGEDALSLFVSLSVDTMNLMTVLKEVGERIVPVNRDRYLLPGGRVFDESALDRIRASPTLAEALREAGRSLFLRPLAALPAPAGGVPFLAVVERQLDRVLLGASRYLARVDPLGWGPLVSFLLDKLREVRNLRMIVRARLVDLPESELGHLLILEY
ncbi:MAG TPA: V-type ATPase subunit [Candidatus Deferrimicrobiaceae bacterium]|nr:V-type ATPase subunit [Candidatus Deferrimicrobiaceae bacterium]